MSAALLKASRAARSACKCGTKENDPIWHFECCEYRQIEDRLNRSESDEDQLDHEISDDQPKAWHPDLRDMDVDAALQADLDINGYSAHFYESNGFIRERPDAPATVYFKDEAGQVWWRPRCGK